MIDIDSRELDGYTFIDLFAGIGGFRIALESLGAKCVFSSEIDSDAAEVYNMNFGETPFGDISQVEETDIPDHDILCAGFPCQAFSAGGRKLGFEDSRGTLFFDVARIVKRKLPKVVLMENVMALVQHDNGRTFSVIRTTMEGLGYIFFYDVLNSAHYGVPQQRKRIYMICFRKDLDISSFSFPFQVPLTHSLKDVLMDESEIPLNLYREVQIYAPARKPRENKNDVILFGFFNKARQGERVYRTSGAAITIETRNKGYYLVSDDAEEQVVRKLHHRECARLMGLPDSFVLHPMPTIAYQQIGNSVVVDVVQYIAKAIARELNGEGVDLILV